MSNLDLAMQLLGHPDFPLKTVGDAHAAFSLVAPKDNWKDPIDRAVKCSHDEALFIRYAIGFMCGEGARAINQFDGTYRFIHPGYYVVIGA